MSTQLNINFRSPFPEIKIPRRQESVATDTIYTDTLDINCGHTMAQCYCRTDSQVCDIYGMKTNKEFITFFEGIIRQREAMGRLISDQAQIETSGRMLDLLRAYVIGNWNSEPHQQQQNHVEGKYKHIKQTTNYTIERSGSPAYYWLLALL